MFKKSSRVLLVTLLLFVLAGATYAFAATNTFPDEAGYAGDGSGTISGYDVTNIHYSTSGDYITGVTFTLDAGASVVQAGLNDSSLVACSAASVPNTNWSCNLTATNVTILNALSLRVVAVQ
jgi:hypothetical protein